MITISVGQLSRRGVFRSPFNAIELPYAQCNIVASYLPAHGRLSLMIDEDGAGTVLKHVEIGFLPLKFGSRPEFVCPCCGQRRRLLIYDRAKLICTERFRAFEETLTHLKRREALKDDRLRRRAANALIDGANVKRRDFKKDVGRKDPLSTYHAFELGRGAAQDDVFSEFQAVGRTAVEEAAQRDDPNWSPLGAGCLSDFPVLDIIELGRRGWFQSQNLRALQVGWPHHLCEGFTLTIFVDTRFMDRPAVFVARRQGGELHRWQHLPLYQRGGAAARWMFRCPVLGTPAEKLYFRSQQFASRQAQRLYHPKKQ